MKLIRKQNQKHAAKGKQQETAVPFLKGGTTMIAFLITADDDRGRLRTRAAGK